MTVEFIKYHGTGNDFILIDNRKLQIDKKDKDRIDSLCDRHFGIGADGLILLENSELADFKMIYFNSDGNESSMCGNGGRCIAHFARSLGLVTDKAAFEAVDGIHNVRFEDEQIALSMSDVKDMVRRSDAIILDTGSPHYVTLVNDIDTLEVKVEGAKIRNSADFIADGINVNFVEQSGQDNFVVRTYERGVEDETLSCGTGVTAVALAMHRIGKTEGQTVGISTPGGNLQVRFNETNFNYGNIWLIGPAEPVFKGRIKW